MAMSKQEIQAILEMVIAGGKSPQTGGDGLMIAATLIQILQREMRDIEASEKPANGAAHEKSEGTAVYVG